MRTGLRLIPAIVLVSFLLFSVIPAETSATPFKVQGYLMDSNGMPIPLETVSITAYFYNTSMGGDDSATINVTTNATGYFMLALGVNEPGGINYGEDLIVSYDTGEKIVSKVVEIEGLGMWVNLTLEKKVSLPDVITSPYALVILVVAISAILIGYYIYKTSSDKKPSDGDGPKPKRVERRRRQR